jgi:uncharacterized membrane protein
MQSEIKMKSSYKRENLKMQSERVSLLLISMNYNVSIYHLEEAKEELNDSIQDF